MGKEVRDRVSRRDINSGGRSSREAGGSSICDGTLPPGVAGAPPSSRQQLWIEARAGLLKLRPRYQAVSFSGNMEDRDCPSRVAIGIGNAGSDNFICGCNQIGDILEPPRVELESSAP